MTETFIKRTAFSLWDALRDIGAVITAISTLSGYLMGPVSELGFKIKVITTLFDVKTDDEKLKKKDEIYVSNWERLKLLMGCFKNKKISKMLSVGTQKMLHEFDIS